MDKYDIAIQHLTENPEEILNTWSDPFASKSGCLFLFASSTGGSRSTNNQTHGPDGKSFGCLTMIRSRPHAYCAEGRPDLDLLIVNDVRIPEDVRDINVTHLEAFAEWQRRFDIEFNRE